MVAVFWKSWWQCRAVMVKCCELVLQKSGGSEVQLVTPFCSCVCLQIVQKVTWGAIFGAYHLPPSREQRIIFVPTAELSVLGFLLGSAVHYFFHRPPTEPLLSFSFWTTSGNCPCISTKLWSPFQTSWLLSSSSYCVPSLKTTADKFVFSYPVFLGCPKDYYNWWIYQQQSCTTGIELTLP